MLKWHQTNISGNNFLFLFIVFIVCIIVLIPVANMAANYVCIKCKSKVFGFKEISYVDVTWYVGSKQ